MHMVRLELSGAGLIMLATYIHVLRNRDMRYNYIAHFNEPSSPSKELWSGNQVTFEAERILAD